MISFSKQHVNICDREKTFKTKLTTQTMESFVRKKKKDHKQWGPKTDMVANNCNPRILEAKAGRASLQVTLGDIVRP